MTIREPLFGKTYNELLGVVKDLGMPAYSARQIAEWLYKKNVSSPDGMTNLSKKFRNELKKKFAPGTVPWSKENISADGAKKYLFPVSNAEYVETVYIPEQRRKTVCISTQVGCKWGCGFCMTGSQGFRGNLTAGEILNQLASLPEKEEVTNIVYMGMGEPLDNPGEVLKSLDILTSAWGYGMSPRRITVSTIGIMPQMGELLKKSNCRLAISLHSPFEDERLKIMPVEKHHPFKKLLKEIRSFDFENQRRVSIEYVIFRGINHSRDHAAELAKVLNGLKCRVNLIPCHPVPGSRFQEAGPEQMQDFKEALSSKGIPVTIRRSRGRDISAACGQLSTKKP